MLQDQMNTVMEELNGEICERDELIHTLAVALLCKRNLFILGETGQAKSYAVNEFIGRITGAKLFSKQLSKQSDEEQLFGRLDLASIIPGNVSQSTLLCDETYRALSHDLEQAVAKLQVQKPDAESFKEVSLRRKLVQEYRMAMAELKGGEPSILTKGKIPDAHIVFLDELFKAGDGLLNSLLTAFNERTWTNEGNYVRLPVISYITASNEIPDFNDPEEKIMKPLYDRMDLKVLTHYVEDRENRISMMRRKANSHSGEIRNTLSLDELARMQEEVLTVEIPERIFELVDDILCTLRKKDVAVSDRKIFNFGPVVQAEAWLDGCAQAEPKHLRILEQYLWNRPEEIAVIHEVLERIIDDPLKEQLDHLLSLALESYAQFDAAENAVRGLAKLRTEFSKVYRLYQDIKNNYSDPLPVELQETFDKIETMNRDACAKASFTYVPLAELEQLLAA